MSRREWATAAGVIAAAVAAIIAIAVITGQPLTTTIPHPATTTHPVNDSGWVWPSPDSAGRMVLNNLLTVEPPAGGTPKYAAQAATERAVRGGWVKADRESPLVTLRLASFLEQFHDRLVWLLQYPNEPMMMGGQLHWLSTPDTPTQPSGVCEFVVVMDASVDSGTYRYDNRYNVLLTLSVCWPKGATLVGGVL